MNFKKELQDANVKAAMVSSLLFFILAFPDLFQAVDTLMRKILGGKMYNMHLIVLTIHSVLFGVLFYYINQFLQKPVLVEGTVEVGKAEADCLMECGQKNKDPILAWSYYDYKDCYDDCTK